MFLNSYKLKEMFQSRVLYFFPFGFFVSLLWVFCYCCHSDKILLQEGKCFAEEQLLGASFSILPGSLLKLVSLLIVSLHMVRKAPLGDSDWKISET